MGFELRLSFDKACRESTWPISHLLQNSPFGTSSSLVWLWGRIHPPQPLLNHQQASLSCYRSWAYSAHLPACRYFSLGIFSALVCPTQLGRGVSCAVFTHSFWTTCKRAAHSAAYSWRSLVRALLSVWIRSGSRAAAELLTFAPVRVCLPPLPEVFPK